MADDDGRRAEVGLLRVTSWVSGWELWDSGRGMSASCAASGVVGKRKQPCLIVSVVSKL